MQPKSPGREPSVIQAATDPVDLTRVMFQRFLTAWAADILWLRRLGLDRPCQRRADFGGPACPGACDQAEAGAGMESSATGL